MELLKIFPHLNAGLNAMSGLMLALGLYFIISGRTRAHRASMLTASLISALFLVSYIIHHVIRTSIYGLGPTRFAGEGLARPIYFTILTSHTILASVIAPFIVLTLWRALKGKFDAHKRLARIVYPVWLYVSFTGVAVYLLLYQLYPAK
jgi:uncharacterized membrane protein YozB (DUF420 family)